MPYYWGYSDTAIICHNYKYVTKGEFGGNQNFAVFEKEAHADSNYLYMKYCFLTTNLCDVYVDWVEFMDKEQGWPLWDESQRPITLDTIENECNYLIDLAESYDSDIVGFEIGDVPKRGSFRCLGILNDSLFAGDDTLSDRGPRVQVAAHNKQSKLLYYFDKANPRVYDPYLYPYAWENSPGNQSELDSLAELLEDSYQKSMQEEIPMVFLLQAHDLDTSVASGSDRALRNPIRSEILAETYMALAHGSKGIYFFKYQSSGDYTMRGLVTSEAHGYQHPDTGGYNVSWAGKNLKGQPVSSGIYLLKMQVDQYQQTRKMLILR